MQKVISALEHLEQFAASADSERDTIECLQRTVTHLELEEAKKVEERQRNDLELQQVEEHYKQETRDDDGFACGLLGLKKLGFGWKTICIICILCSECSCNLLFQKKWYNLLNFIIKPFGGR